jgi:hypothetical protein
LQCLGRERITPRLDQQPVLSFWQICRFLKHHERQFDTPLPVRGALGASSRDPQREAAMKPFNVPEAITGCFGLVAILIIAAVIMALIVFVLVWCVP